MRAAQIIFLSIPLLVSPLCLTARLDVRTGADRTAVNIGDPVHFYVLLEHPADMEVELPPAGEELGPFEVLEYSVTNLESGRAGRTQKAARYKITAYFLGSAEIPSLLITGKDKSGKEERVRTEPVTVTIMPLEKQPGDTDDIRELKKQIYLPDPFLLILILSLFPAGAAAWVYFRYFRKKGATSPLPAPAPDAVLQSEDEEALEKIRLLIEKKYLEKGRIKVYYYKLCEIMRFYLFRRFAIPTLERTSYEIMRDLRKTPGKRDTEGFASFFEQTDLVKFARYLPSSQETRDITAAAIGLIRKTGKKEEAAHEVL